MAMAVDNRQHQLPMNNLSYDQMRYVTPQFTNPWTSPNQTSSLYAQQSLPPVSSGLNGKVSAAGQLPYMATSGPQLSSSNPYSFDQTNSLDNAQNMLSQRSYGQDFSSPATTQASAFAPTSAPYASAFPQTAYSTYGQDTSRPNYTQRAPQTGREGFTEALDASRNMLAMNSQTDLTPRNIYGADIVRQVSQDAYGFPATHSTHSSISSASGYPYNYGTSLNSSISGSMAGSVDGSVTDYSSAGEEAMGSRTLPRPVGYMSGSLPPAASSMMSQFNSKVSPSTQKKHKCKICDKRFTRPSSLQTHMYSHTGEKPFACDAEGCGRHFSVVSNLRRHKKVHRGENDHPSPDDE